MEPQLKTSFIPKQSLAQQAPAAPKHHRPKRGFNLATAFGLLILILAGGAAGFVFFYHQLLEGEIIEKTRQLEIARESFDQALVKELERLDTRMESARQILDLHVAPSELFELLEASTLKSVRFSSMAYVDRDGTYEVELTGQALNFDAVALQSDVFGSNRFIKQPVISDLEVEDVASEIEGVPNTTRVSFVVNARVDSQFMRYRNLITNQSAAEGFQEVPEEPEVEAGSTNETIEDITTTQ